MEIEPWLAKEWENVDELTWKITLQDNVKFSSGRDMDAEAVKECLEHLIENHERAKNDLKIDSMEADGQILTIHTSEPKPALLNYLGDPYGCIIDVDAGFDDGIVAGTGPYIAVPLQMEARWPMRSSREKYRQPMVWLMKATRCLKMMHIHFHRFPLPVVSLER